MNTRFAPFRFTSDPREIIANATAKDIVERLAFGQYYPWGLGYNVDIDFS